MMMKRPFPVMKSLAAVALALGVSIAAHADDNSMNPFNGDSYAYFHENRPMVDRTPSTFRVTNPHGLSDAQYQALSSEDPVWQLDRPVIDKTPSTFRQAYPHGLPFAY